MADTPGIGTPTPEIGEEIGSPAPRQASTVTTVDFDGTHVVASSSALAAAIEAEAKGQIAARYALAIQRPRNIDTVRNRLLEICRKPSFAEAAWYKKPIGGGRKVEGLSIRFAEEAIKVYRNAMVQARAIHDNDEIRITSVVVTDIENNVTWVQDLTIPKQVERSSTGGRTPIGPPRKNTKGEAVYLLPATNDEMLQLENAAISKAARNGILRIIPEYVLEDCVDEIAKTNQNKAAEDPTAARKKIFDALYTLGIDGEMVEMYLGHEINSASPAEIAELRGIYQVISDNEATWPDIMQAKGLRSGAIKGESASPQARAAAEKIEKRKQDAEKKEEEKKADNGNTKPDNKPEPKPKQDPPPKETRPEPKPEPKPEPAAEDFPEVDGPASVECMCPNGPAGRHHPKCGELTKKEPESGGEKGSNGDLFSVD